MNSSILHARSNEAIRPPSNDERRASWAAKYFCAGFHRRPEKPRVRVTVPAPLSTREPDESEQYASEQYAPDPLDDTTDEG